MPENVRTMTIVVNAEDEKDMLILADKMDGIHGFHEEKIRFLKNVLKNLEEKSQEMREEYNKGLNEYDAAMWG